MSKAVLGELPEGVESAMFLRDTWEVALWAMSVAMAAETASRKV